MCDETTTQPAPERPLETLRSAIKQMRDDAEREVILRQGDPYWTTEASVFERRMTPPAALSTADLLAVAAADLWAYGPLHCNEGCTECDDELWAPYARRALVVARTYLGAVS